MSRKIQGQLLYEPSNQHQSKIIGGKNRNEFAEEVLHELRSTMTTFRGCLPDYVEIFFNGRVKVWFWGYVSGRPWRGGVGFNCTRPEDRVYMADPAIVAEMCRKHIALTNAE